MRSLRIIRNDENFYDCFHCVYRINALEQDGITITVPLMIMKSNHNGGCGGGGTDDTRLVLNQSFQTGGEYEHYFRNPTHL